MEPSSRSRPKRLGRCQRWLVYVHGLAFPLRRKAGWPGYRCEHERRAGRRRSCAYRRLLRSPFRRLPKPFCQTVADAVATQVGFTIVVGRCVCRRHPFQQLVSKVPIRMSNVSKRISQRRAAVQILYQSEITGVPADKLVDEGLAPKRPRRMNMRANWCGVSAHRAELDCAIGESSQNGPSTACPWLTVRSAPRCLRDAPC